MSGWMWLTAVVAGTAAGALLACILEGVLNG